MLSIMDRLSIYRAVRISVMLTIAVATWLFFDIERGYWIAMTLMIIYMPFEPGLVNNRIKMRLIGTVVGLLFGFVLVEIVIADVTWLAFLPLVVLFVLYFSMINYTYSSMFVTVAVMLFYSAMYTKGMSPATFMLARLMDTFTACAICFIAEVFFRPRKMIAHAILKDLEDILEAYAKHFRLMYESFAKQQFKNISIEYSMNFNNSLLSLKQAAELNKTKLRLNHQQLMDACLEPVFKMRVHLISLHYLAEYNEEEMYAFITQHQTVFVTICDNLSQLLTYDKTRQFSLNKVFEKNNFKTDVEREIIGNLLSFNHLAYQSQSALIEFKQSSN
ncbi:FUSC family protein [Cysteiniphilum halobium]|uniref:FUSC family protein n=1 Tax=Cysteiniphilum halobium TaxID=2219059 RepID=UPI000E64C382|nr:FUSC family protein [Cysteiniphilum halobium]